MPTFDLECRHEFLARVTTGMAVVDCKSIYDDMHSDNSPGVQCKRVAIDMLITKEALARCSCPPASCQVADVLTKDAAEPTDKTRAFMRLGKYCMDEEWYLKAMYDEKDRRIQIGIARARDAHFPSARSVLSRNWGHDDHKNRSHRERNHGTFFSWPTTRSRYSTRAT